ncbi:hypothetical protein LPB41_05555 [Thalassospira sp. MA62]|nr:hypothetical protein [Thalassospira sp. MA62]
MFRNSFTSSSSQPQTHLKDGWYRRKVMLLLAFTLAWFLALTGISFAAYRLGVTDFAFTKLFEYQVEKIRTVQQFETVFVGDSSLGTGIDAQTWEELSGEKTINLALNGAYGYAGSLNMLRRVLEKGQPEKVIIIQAGDMLARDVAWNGWLHTALSTDDFFEVPIPELFKTFANFDGLTSAARALVGRVGLSRSNPISNDYVTQGPPLSLGGDEKFEVPLESFNTRKTIFLNALGEFCRENSLDCRYGIGSWYEQYCQQNPEWIDLVFTKVREAGLTPFASPYCFGPEKLGDSFDHVAAPYKKQATKYYFDQLNAAKAEAGELKGTFN